ncbi:hypothetical protein [Streptomyces flaveus]|uniref:hypothetical protein n=1 Tax=Streptomyces flaveus TaxID=66370 RepID=UPI0033234AB5
MPEFIQLQGAEGGNEIVVHVVGDGLVRVGVEAAGLALQERPQGALGGVGAGEAASPDGRPAAVWGGDVDGEGPRPVVTVGEQEGQCAPSWRRWAFRQPHHRQTRPRSAVVRMRIASRRRRKG